MKIIRINNRAYNAERIDDFLLCGDENYSEIEIRFQNKERKILRRLTEEEASDLFEKIINFLTGEGTFLSIECETF